MSNSIPHGFRQIPGFPRYAIDEHGTVLSVCRPGPGDKTNRWSDATPMKPWIDRDGYHRICLSHDGREQTVTVHKLVLATFSGPCPNGMQCRHVDGNPANNHVSNLAWGSSSENHRDKILHGTTSRGEKCYRAKLTEKDVIEIRERAANGETQIAIAKDFRVLNTCICNIVHRRTWKHI